jgi:ParB-like chromosome segregation protein Spo0J
MTGELKTLKISELKSHPDGVRVVTPEAVYQLSLSIKTFGLLRPLTLNTRTGWILDGDNVLVVLRSMKGMDMVPVWCVDIPEELEDVAHLALNNHCGEWQWEPVSRLLKTVEERKQSVGLTGFHESDIGPLLAADWSPAAKGPLDGSDPAQATLL